MITVEQVHIIVQLILSVFSSLRLIRLLFITGNYVSQAEESRVLQGAGSCSLIWKKYQARMVCGGEFHWESSQVIIIARQCPNMTDPPVYIESLALHHHTRLNMEICIKILYFSLSVRGRGGHTQPPHWLDNGSHFYLLFIIITMLCCVFGNIYLHNHNYKRYDNGLSICGLRCNARSSDCINLINRVNCLHFYQTEYKIRNEYKYMYGAAAA